MAAAASDTKQLVEKKVQNEVIEAVKAATITCTCSSIAVVQQNFSCVYNSETFIAKTRDELVKNLCKKAGLSPEFAQSILTEKPSYNEKTTLTFPTEFFSELGNCLMTIKAEHANLNVHGNTFYILKFSNPGQPAPVITTTVEDPNAFSPTKVKISDFF